MNHRRMPLVVNVQAITQEADELDGIPEVWSTVGQAYGDIRSLAGREYAEGDQMKGEATHEVTTRWVRDAHPRQRLAIAGKHYEVESVLNVDERNHWTKWRVRELV